MVLGLTALLVASPFGAIFVLFPFALPRILIRQRDEARLKTKELRRIIASQHGLVSAWRDLDRLIAASLERAGSKRDHYGNRTETEQLRTPWLFA